MESDTSSRWNQTTDTSNPSRREVLRASTVAGATAVGLSFIGSSTAAPSEFTHPGALHTQADFDRMSAKVDAEEEPWWSGYELLRDHSLSSSFYSMNGPYSRVDRGDDYANVEEFRDDANAAYQNAVMWGITGDQAHADVALDVVTGYANEGTEFTGSEVQLLVGLAGYKVVQAAEIVRHMGAGMTSSEASTVENWFLNEMWPDVDGSSGLNGNWGTAAIKCQFAIAIFCSDGGRYDTAVDHFKNADCAGVDNILFPTGQYEESGRDQGHAQLGISHIAASAQQAYNQGTDLFNYADERLRAAFEYSSRYNLGNSVPYDQPPCGDYRSVSDQDRGNFSPIYEMVSNHYVKEKGVAAPYTEEVVTTETRPEGAAFKADQVGFGTILFARGGKGASSDVVTEATYRVDNVNSGLALTVDGGSTSDGANVLQSSYDGNDSQRFYIKFDGSGYYLEPVHSGKVVDVASGSTDDGADVIQWTDDSGDNHRFRLEQEGSGYRIEAAHSGKIVEVANGSTTDGANVQQWSDNGGDHQRWQLTPVRPPTGTYRIAAQHAGKVLDVSDESTSDGANVQQWSDSGRNNQYWNVEHTGNGVYRIENVNSLKVLEVDGSSTADSANVRQWTDSGGDNQRFAIEYDGSGYRIEAVHSGKVLDVEGASTDDGANVHQWGNAGGDNQRWMFYTR